ncbi:hypothetical protein BGZ97_010209, partial [Linnemannia gamsii]
SSDHVSASLAVEDIKLPLLPVTLPKYQAVPSPPEPRQPPETRTFDDAVLHSCGELYASVVEKQKTLGIVEVLGLKPFSIKDAHGVEQNALAHSSVISRFPARPAELRSVLSQKRKLDEHESCSNCSPALAPGSEHVFSSSPYAARLATRQYVEMNDEICELLNRDWQLSPHLRFSCAVIIAGCLLVNFRNGQAVIANTVE